MRCTSSTCTSKADGCLCVRMCVRVWFWGAVSEHEPCAGIIDSLRTDLHELEKAKDAQIAELKAHLKRLDKKLAEELEKEEALAKQLAEEKRKEKELEKSLKKTKAELEKDERDLAEDKKVFASKVRLRRD